MDLTETIVSDAHSAPDLSYPREPYDEEMMESRLDSRSMTHPHSDAMTSPSSTPVTPVHENSRIAIHKGQSSSSITYEYTVNEDNSSQEAMSRDMEDVRVGVSSLSMHHHHSNGGGMEELTSASEAEQSSKMNNGMARSHDGLSMHNSSNISFVIPSVTLRLDLDHKEPKPLFPPHTGSDDRLGLTSRRPRLSDISHSSSNRTSTSSDVTRDDSTNEQDTTEERLAVLDTLAADSSECSDFVEEEVPLKSAIGLQTQISNNSEDLGHPRPLSISSSSDTSEIKLSSSSSSGSADLDMIQSRANNGLRLSRSIDEALKIAHDLSSPTDDQYTVSSFETRSLESFAPEHGDAQFNFRGFAASGLPDVALQTGGGDPSKPFLFTGKHCLTFSEDEEIEENLDITNQKVQVLEDNLDETAASLQQLELSLAETRESLKEMETDVLSSDSEEEDARVERVLQQARRVQEKLLQQPLSAYKIQSFPLDTRHKGTSSSSTGAFISENISMTTQSKQLETVPEVVDVTPNIEDKRQMTSDLSPDDDQCISSPEQDRQSSISYVSDGVTPEKQKDLPNLTIGDIAIVREPDNRPISPPSKPGQFVSELRLKIVRSPPPTPTLSGADMDRHNGNDLDEFKRDSRHSVESDDSAKQTFADRSVDDILQSKDISHAQLENESIIVQCNMSDHSSISDDDDISDSDSSTSSNDSCIYQYKVAEAKLTKSKGGMTSSSSEGEQEDEGAAMMRRTRPVTNGLFRRHASLSNGGIIKEVPENGELFDDLQSGGELLDREGGESVANSDDFD